MEIYLLDEAGDTLLDVDDYYLILGELESVNTYPAAPIPSYIYKPGSKFNTLISDFDSGAEQRNRLWRFPKRTFLLKYDYVDQANRHILHEFYRERYGSNISFWYFDLKKDYWDDEFCGYGGPLVIDEVYANDGGTYTDETEEAEDATTNDMTLLPAVPAVNDSYDFGGKNPFNKLTIVIGTAGAGNWTITWEYLDDDGNWTALAGVADGTVGFTAAAGSHDVTWTMPTDWININHPDNTNSPICYWVRGRVSAYVNIVTQPLGTSAGISSTYFDIPGKTVTNDGTFLTYVNGATTAKTFVSGGGGGGADRFFFAAYPAQGAVITCDFYGYLRIKGRYIEDLFNEEIPYSKASDYSKTLYQISLGIQEVQW